MNLKKYIAELKRRHVFKAGLAYLIAAWVFTEVAALVLDAYSAPPYFLKTILIIIAIGFPILLAFSWVYDLTPEGIKKTSKTNHTVSISPKINHRLNRVIIAFLSIAVLLLLVNQFKDGPIHNEGKAKSAKINQGNETSIAVLAFSDLSPDHDQEYFSDGISEELLNLLSKIPELKVISRTSSFSYKGKNVTIEQIGEELNVTHILEGSVRKSGNKIRITTQLIDVAEGSHIWSETYDRDMEDIFEIQDEIAEVVTQQLKITLFGDIAKTTEVNPEAYTLYLQANHLYQLHTEEAIRKAEDVIKQSIAIDSAYAPSWNLFSRIINTATANFYQKPYKEGLEFSKTAALKSLELDNTYAPAYAQLAGINSVNRNYAAAEKNINRALALDDGNSLIISKAAEIARNGGRLDKNTEYLLQAIKLNPLEYRYYYNLGIVYIWLGRWDEAYDAIEKYLYFRPEAAVQHAMIAHILVGQGKKQEAWEEVQKEPSEFWNLYTSNVVANSLGNYQVADSLLVEFIDQYSDSNPVMLACLYADRDETENTFIWLEIAYEQKDPDLTEAINYNNFSKYYQDPRWKALITKLGLPKDHWLLKKRK